MLIITYTGDAHKVRLTALDGMREWVAAFIHKMA